MRLARTSLHHAYPGGKEPVLELASRAVEGDLEGALGFAQAYVEQITTCPPMFYHGIGSSGEPRRGY
jgi:hypothetical protein